MDALRADIIDKTLKNNNFTKTIYQGIFSCDKLTDHVISSFPCGFVVNFDTSSEPGSHWIGLFFDRFKNVEYFDTYARPINTNKDIYNFIQKTGNKSIKYLTGASIQDDTSSVCGHYTILYLLCRAKKISFQCFVNTFSDQSESGDYDSVVRKIVNELITISLNKKQNPNKTCITCFCDPGQKCSSKYERECE
jgi:hypothetical protein